MCPNSLPPIVLLCPGCRDAVADLDIADLVGHLPLWNPRTRDHPRRRQPGRTRPRGLYSHKVRYIDKYIYIIYIYIYYIFILYIYILSWGSIWYHCLIAVKEGDRYIHIYIYTYIYIHIYIYIYNIKIYIYMYMYIYIYITIIIIIYIDIFNI